MKSVAVQNRIRKEAIDYLINALEPATPTGQNIIYSDALGPDSDEETILEYLQRINID